MILKIFLLTGLLCLIASQEIEVSRLKRDTPPWELNPNVQRDANGNVIAGAQVIHHGENHDVQASWSKVVQGPNRAKPTWNVGGTIRWRRDVATDLPEGLVNHEDESYRLKRDVQPWELNPNVQRDQNGNVIAGAQVKHHGENHDVQASWSKVVQGPNRAKPTWNVGGTIRWRREVATDLPERLVHHEDESHRLKRDVQPWELNPNVQRDQNGNVLAGAQVKHHGENHDVQASWSKVVQGPNRAKPTWNVGGTIRWRREAAADLLEDNDQIVDEISRVKRSDDEPWTFNPNIGRSDDGNTQADLNLERHGDNHDIHATWTKVVDGPGRAKPTWNIGGSFRFKRDVQPWELNPNVQRDENGNVLAGAQVKHHGDNHDVQASWSKVVRGPNRAKPTWNVGGSFRF